MTWTTQRPQVPGWYWHRAQFAEPSCVEVVQGPGELFVRGYDKGYVIELLEGEWAGPLPVPVEVPQ